MPSLHLLEAPLGLSRPYIAVPPTTGTSNHRSCENTQKTHSTCCSVSACSIHRSLALKNSRSSRLSSSHAAKHAAFPADSWNSVGEKRCSPRRPSFSHRQTRATILLPSDGYSVVTDASSPAVSSGVSETNLATILHGRVDSRHQLSTSARKILPRPRQGQQVNLTAIQQPIDARHVADNQRPDEEAVAPVIPWYARHLLLPHRPTGLAELHAAEFAVRQMPEGVDAESVELRDGQLNGQPNGQVNGQEDAEKKQQQRHHQWPDLWQPDHGEAHLVDSSGKRLLEPRALLVDAFGTLVETAEEETMVYASIGQKFGVEISPEEIGRRYEVVYRKPWLQSKLRYEGDALPFWHHIISESTGCSNPSYTQELHGYYIKKHAWRFTDPNAREAFAAIRRAGIKIALVSNFDTRLRDLLRALDCYDWFDAVAVSAEVEAEKPSSEIFHAACDMLGVLPHEAVHVGDSRNKDVAGAKRAGCGAAWLWNEDVSSFTEVAQRLGVSIPAASPEVRFI